MQPKKSNIMTMLLLFSVVFLLIGVLVIGYFLSRTSSAPSTVPVAPKKVKASNISYSKLIVLDKNQGNPFPTVEISPTTVVIASPTPDIKLFVQTSPTPKEIILAQNIISPTVTKSASSSPTITKTATASSTIVKKLPVSGVVTNGLMIIFFAGALVFFSFVF